MTKSKTLLVIIMVVVLAAVLTSVMVACDTSKDVQLNTADYVGTFNGEEHRIICSTAEGDLGFSGETNANWRVEYFDADGNLLDGAPIWAGEYTVSITLLAKGYAQKTVTASMVIEKATPTIVKWPTLKLAEGQLRYELVYGTPLSDDMLSCTTANLSYVTGVGGSELPGRFTWSTAVKPDVTKDSYDVLFVPGGDKANPQSPVNNYLTVSMSASGAGKLPVTVLPATPTLLSEPSFSYLNGQDGLVSGDSLLDATLKGGEFVVNVAGVNEPVRGKIKWGAVDSSSETGYILYERSNAPSVTVAGVGTYTAVFVPTDDKNFSSVIFAPKNLVVKPAQPTFRDGYDIPDASAITYGQKLGNSIFENGGIGRADQVEGRFVWADPATVPTESGEYIALFKPNSTEYASDVRVKVQVTVNPVAVMVTLPQVSAIDFDVVLENCQMLPDGDGHVGRVSYLRYDPATDAMVPTLLDGYFEWVDGSRTPNSYPLVGNDTYACPVRFVFAGSEEELAMFVLPAEMNIPVFVNKLAVDDLPAFDPLTATFGTKLSAVALPSYVATADLLDEDGRPIVGTDGQVRKQQIYGTLQWVNPDAYVGDQENYEVRFVPSAEYQQYQTKSTVIAVNYTPNRIDLALSRLPSMAVSVEAGNPLDLQSLVMVNGQIDAAMYVRDYVDADGKLIPIDGTFMWKYSDELVMPNKGEYEMIFRPTNPGYVEEISFMVAVSVVSDSNCFQLEVITEPDGATQGTVRIVGLASHTDCVGGHSHLIINETLRLNGVSYRVTELGAAFRNVVGLVDVVLPDSLEVIGDYAFAGATMLERIVIPRGVKKIGAHAFDGATALASVLVDSAVLSEVGEMAFFGCNRLHSLSLPASLTKLGQGAFAGCGGLQQLELAGNVYSVRNGAVYELTSEGKVLHTYLSSNSAASFRIPADVYKIGAYAFAHNANLLTEVVAESIVSIGSNAFASSPALRYVYVMNEAGILDPSDWATAFDGAENLTVFGRLSEGALVDACAAAGVAYQQWQALDTLLVEYNDADSTARVMGFAVSESLYDLVRRLVIPATVESGGKSYRVVEVGGFGDCDSLESVVIPQSVVSIEEGAFWGSDNLVEVVLNEGLASIGVNAFRSTGLVEIYLPSTLSSIGGGAFGDCGNLSGVTFAADCAMGSTAFVGASQDLLVYGPDQINGTDSIVKLYFASIGVRYNLYTPASCFEYVDEGDYVTITGLRNHICSGHTHIKVPATIGGKPVTTLAAEAFRGAYGVETISLPAGLSYIGKDAFVGCVGLTSIVVDSANRYYRFESTLDADGRMASGVLLNASGSKLLAYMPMSTAEEYTLPDTVSEVADGAFRGSVNLKTVHMSAFLQNLGQQVFAGSAVELVTFANDNHYCFADGIIYNSDRSVLVAYLPSNSAERLHVAATVREVAVEAFAGVSGLQSVIFEGPVDYVRERAFAGCYDLNSVTFYDEVGFVMDSAFASCNNLACVYVEKDMQYLDVTAFDNTPNVVIYSAGGSNLELMCENRFAYASCDSTSLFYYTVSAGNAMISGIKREEFGQTSLRIVLPSYIDGYKVTGILANAFQEYNLPASSAHLVSIYIPQTVQSIGDKAFYSCTLLSDIYFAGDISVVAGVLMVGTDAFKGLGEGVNVTASEDSHIAEYFRTSPDVKDKVNLIQSTDSCLNYRVEESGVTVYGLLNHICNHSHTRLVVPDIIEGKPVVAIATGAFRDSRLMGIYLPESVTTIAADAFKGSTRLSTVYMPGVVEIGAGAFENCVRLDNVTLADGVRVLGAYAFAGCDNLKTLYLKGDLSTSGGDAGDGIKPSAFLNRDGSVPALTVYGPNERYFLQMNGEYALAGTNLRAYIQRINNTYSARITFVPWTGATWDVETDEESMTATITGYSGEERVVIMPALYYLPDGSVYRITAIGDGAFDPTAGHATDSVEEIYINENIRTIGARAFAYMKSLAVVHVAQSVESIGDYAFTGAAMLTEVYFARDVATLGTRIFSAASKELKVYGPAGSHLAEEMTATDKIYNKFVHYNTLTDPACFEYELRADGYAIVGVKDHYCAGGHVSMVLPGYYRGVPIVALAKTAFVGQSALYSLQISANITSIEAGAFAGCSALTNITVDAAGRSYTVVDGVLTDYETRSVLYICLSNNITYTVPDSIRVIKSGAFEGSPVQVLCLTGNIERIESGALEGADDLISIIGLENNSRYDFKNGALLGKENDEPVELLFYLRTLDVPSYEVPGTVRLVREDAFRGTKLVQILFHQDAVVGEGAFAETLPELTVMGVNGTADVQYACMQQGVRFRTTIPTALWKTFEEDDGLSVQGLDMWYVSNGENETAYDDPSAVSGVVYMPAYLNGLPVVAVADNAFTNQPYPGLYGLVLPDTVKRIGVSAFVGSGLTGVVLGKGVVEVAHDALAAESLRDVYILGDTALYEGVFGGYDGEERLHVYYYAHNAATHATLTSADFVATTANRVNVYDLGVMSEDQINALGYLFEDVYEDEAIVGAAVSGLAQTVVLGDPADLLIPSVYYVLDENGYYVMGEDGPVTRPVVALADGALMDNATVIRITLPDGIQRIGTGALSGCGNLSDIVVSEDSRYSFERLYAHLSLNLEDMALAYVSYVGELRFATATKTVVDGEVERTVSALLLDEAWYKGLALGEHTLTIYTAEDSHEILLNTVQNSMTLDGTYATLSFADGFVVLQSALVDMTKVQRVEANVALNSVVGERGVRVSAAALLALVDGEHALYAVAEDGEELAYLLEVSGEELVVYNNTMRRNVAYSEGVLFGLAEQEGAWGTRTVEDALVVYLSVNTDTQYTLPETVRTVEAGAFYGIDSLTSLRLGANVSNVGDRAFVGMSNLETFVVDERNTVLFVDGFGVLHQHLGADGVRLISYPVARGGYTYWIGAEYNVTSLASGAFYGSKLDYLYFESYVDEVGDSIGLLGDPSEVEVEFLHVYMPEKGEMGEDGWQAVPYALSEYLTVTYEGLVLNMHTHKDCFVYDENNVIVGMVEHECLCDHLNPVLPIYRNGQQVKGLASFALRGSAVETVTFYYAGRDFDIGEGAFADCDSLTEIRLPESSEYRFESGVLVKGNTLHTVLASADYVGVELEGYENGAMGEVIFTYVPHFSDFALSTPDSMSLQLQGINEVSAFAFYGNDHVRLVTLGKYVEKVGEGAFTLATELDEIEVHTENSAYRYADGVLYDYDKKLLHTLLYAHTTELTDSLYTVSNGAADSADNVAQIEAYAFAGTLVARVGLPKSLLLIGDMAFGYMPNLTHIYFESEVSSLSSDMGIDILGEPANRVVAYGPGGVNPDSTTSYEEKYSSIFRYFIETYFGELPEMEVMLKDFLWYTDNADVLSAVYQPWTNYQRFEYVYNTDAAGVRTATIVGMKGIGSESLEEGYEDIVVPMFAYGEENEAYRITQIGSTAFVHHTELRSLTLLYNVLNIQEGFAKGAHNLTALNVPDNSTYRMGEGDHEASLMTLDGKTLMLYLPTASRHTYGIADSVRRIAAAAFAYNKELDSIVVPASVEYIGPGAFSSAQDLTNIISRSRYYTFVDYTLLGEDRSLLHTYLATGRGVNGVYVVPEYVRTIGDFAFEGNGFLAEIRIPEYATENGVVSVDEVGMNAFARMKGLQGIFFEGYTEVGERAPGLDLEDNVVFVPTVDEDGKPTGDRLASIVKGEPDLSVAEQYVLNGMPLAVTFGEQYAWGDVQLCLYRGNELYILPEESVSYTLVGMPDGAAVDSEPVSFNRFVPGTYYVFVTVVAEEKTVEF